LGKQVEQISEVHEQHALSWRGHGQWVLSSCSWLEASEGFPRFVLGKTIVPGRKRGTAARQLLMWANRLTKRGWTAPPNY